MPVMRGHTKKGPYFRWGISGKNYYYTRWDYASRNRARAKAEKQGKAILASGFA